VLSITGVDRLVDTFPSVAASLAGRSDQPGQPNERGAREQRGQARSDTAAAGADTDGGA
jgi:hypothetical protein